jgi:DedD protein
MAAIPIVDIQAKDRLTGAVILVALVVLLVPELLSGPSSKHAPVASTASESSPLRSYTVELGDNAHVRRTADTAAEAAPPSAVAPAPAVATAPSAPQPAIEPPPLLAQAPTAVPPAPATAAVAGRARPEPAPAASGGWMIQLGSFASRTNAERLVRDLKAKGYAAFVSDSATGRRELYRVRVGPAPDHASAQALAAKLRAAGHPGSLTSRP